MLLWFGTIKNAGSSYAPGWVLADRTRFPRAVTRPSTLPFAKGEPPISLFGPAVQAADARAFGRLMAHLAEVDPQHTVIAVQIENETGILGDARDRSPAAERAWNAPVPAALLAGLEQRGAQLSPELRALWARGGNRRSGSWSTVFGTDWQAEEVFMAWHVGRFVDAVAAAGKTQLRLPMYANAWIGPQKPGEPAGNYPSGGPVPRMFDVWRIGAPRIDWLSRISMSTISGAGPGPMIARAIRCSCRKRSSSSATCSSHSGSCGRSGSRRSESRPGCRANQMAQAYDLLRGAVPLLVEGQARRAITGFALAPGETHRATLGNYGVTVRGQRDALSKLLLDMGVPVPAPVVDRSPQNIGDHPSELADLRPMGLIVQLGPDEFLVAGKDLNVEFRPTGPGTPPAEIERIEEGRYVDGHWVAGRVLNGDERLRIVPSDRFGMVRIRLLKRRS